MAECCYFRQVNAKSYGRPLRWFRKWLASIPAHNTLMQFFRLASLLFMGCLLVWASLGLTSTVNIGRARKGEVSFKKTTLDSRFLAEGVAVGDVNRDGKLDVVAGNVWFESPSWKPHEIAPVTPLEPKTQYSNAFHNWASDLNGDGWIDQIVIGMPGEKAVWRENPKGNPQYWKEHFVWRSAGNESPLYEDLLGHGKNVLVMGTEYDYLAWFEPAEDPYAPWIMHKISELRGSGSQRYSHGLGIGDLDGNGRNEVIATGGYYVRPVDPRKGPWKFVKADLGPDCAHMRVLDKGILTTSAHRRGVWWFRPKVEGGFERQILDETISQTHAANLMFLGKDRTPNLITGKRKWAHPPGVDPGSEEASWIVRYEYRQGKWTRHLIDEDSGVGTQFVVQDVNGDGRADIVVANKNGVFLFDQEPHP